MTLAVSPGAVPTGPPSPSPPAPLFLGGGFFGCTPPATPTPTHTPTPSHPPKPTATHMTSGGQGLGLGRRQVDQGAGLEGGLLPRGGKGWGGVGGTWSRVGGFAGWGWGHVGSQWVWRHLTLAASYTGARGAWLGPRATIEEEWSTAKGGTERGGGKGGAVSVCVFVCGSCLLWRRRQQQAEGCVWGGLVCVYHSGAGPHAADEALSGRQASPGRTESTATRCSIHSNNKGGGRVPRRPRGHVGECARRDPRQQGGEGRGGVPAEQEGIEEWEQRGLRDEGAAASRRNKRSPRAPRQGDMAPVEREGEGAENKREKGTRGRREQERNKREKDTAPP